MMYCNLHASVRGRHSNGRQSWVIPPNPSSDLIWRRLIYVITCFQQAKDSSYWTFPTFQLTFSRWDQNHIGFPNLRIGKQNMKTQTSREKRQMLGVKELLMALDQRMVWEDCPRALTHKLHRVCALNIAFWIKEWKLSLFLFKDLLSFILICSPKSAVFYFLKQNFGSTDKQGFPCWSKFIFCFLYIWFSINSPTQKVPKLPKIKSFPQCNYLFVKYCWTVGICRASPCSYSL